MDYTKLKQILDDAGYPVSSGATFTSDDLVQYSHYAYFNLTGFTREKAFQALAYPLLYPQWFQDLLNGGPAERTLLSIAISGALSTAIGSTSQLVATGTYNVAPLTEDITDSATWASSDTDVATVAAGLVTGVAEGSSNVTASVGEISSSPAAFSVTAVAPTRTLQSIALTGDTSITEAETSQLTATGTYNVAPLTEDITDQVTYGVTGSAAGSVSASGLYTPANDGAAVITASLAGVTSPDLNVTVAAVAPTLVSIAVTGADTVNVGNTITLTATGTYSDESTQDLTASAVWASSVEADATVAAGVVTGVSDGSSDITATVDGVTSPAHTVLVIA